MVILGLRIPEWSQFKSSAYTKQNATALIKKDQSCLSQIEIDQKEIRGK